MTCKCAVCGANIIIDVVDIEDVVCCSEECEDLFDNPPRWEPDQHYRAGYDYACGYYD